MSESVSVVGGGVIGLASAWRLAQSGRAVTVFDERPGHGASWVAGGMLAPLSEGWPGEEPALRIGSASLERWPTFAADLAKYSDEPLLTTDNSVTVALDSADAADLDTIAEFLADQGVDSTILDRTAIHALEPTLGRRVRKGLLTEGEGAANNRAVVTALLAACRAEGVTFVADAVTDLASVPGDRVVLAAGYASAQLAGLPIRPVKGEVLRLRARATTAPRPTRTIRATVHGRPNYLVPRVDGLVIGATQYETGPDTEPTVAGVRDLLSDAQELLPTIGEFGFLEASAGLRPMTPDNLPIIGPVGERVVAATGHGRNGILMTPVTADAVVAELDGRPLPEAAAASPERFTLDA